MSEKKQDLQGLLDKMRKKVSEGRTSRDVDELKIPKDLKGDFKVRFVVLPGFNVGDTYSNRRGESLIPKIADASDSMDDSFYIPNGKHWMLKQYKECPRAHHVGFCPLCTLGFDLMEGQDKATRSEIAKKYLAQEKWAINIYITNDDINPEAYRDRVMWVNLPKTIQDKFVACLEREDSGDDQDPQAFSIFFHQENMYVFQFHAYPKGDYPNYGDSKFLVSGGATTLQKIVDTTKSKFSVEEILNLRFSLRKKFDSINVDELQNIVDRIKSGVVNIDSDDQQKDSEDSQEEREKIIKKVQETIDESEQKEVPQTKDIPAPKAPKKIDLSDEVAVDEALNDIVNNVLGDSNGNKEKEKS